jgi:protease I
MAEKTLDGMRVAILITNDFEQSEMTEPRKALDEAGARRPCLFHEHKQRGRKVA